jgi:hypothetical protein
MRKTRKRCQEAVDVYAREIRRLYPEAVVEVLPDQPPGGFDYWVNVYLPGRGLIRAKRKLIEVEESVYDRFGVSMLTFVRSRNGKAAA